jgi:hypothetical protein
MNEGDLSIEEAAAQADPLIRDGATVFFKFTCASCGSRQMFDVPNTVYREGGCEECGHVTDLNISGCGYMLVLGGVLAS